MKRGTHYSRSSPRAPDQPPLQPKALRLKILPLNPNRDHYLPPAPEEKVNRPNATQQTLDKKEGKKKIRHLLPVPQNAEELAGT